MPTLDNQSVEDFERAFRKWKGCFVGPRLRPEGQDGPDLRFLNERLEARAGLEKAFENMVEKNNK